MKRTKILATYGPSIASADKIASLIARGANAFRVNCSHSTTAELKTAAEIIQKGSAKARFPIGLLFDISGPKLRLGRFEGEVPVATGETITLTKESSDPAKRIIGVNNKAVIDSVKKGERFYVDDGNIRFEIIRADKTRVTAKALNDGVLLPSKGINLPDSEIKIPTISAKDKDDIANAVKAGADYIALSFVRSGDDVIEAKKIIKRLGGNQRVIAKLEKKEAIERLDSIMLMSDGVMVARGDLGVELPYEDLPRLQKKIIKLANYHHKPVIVATQMLESMRFAPRATRAEVNDVASAVFDFVDCVMLSAETASGKYPLESVETMTKIIEANEAANGRPTVQIDNHFLKLEIPIAIAEAVSHSRERCESKAVFAFTTSGFTAQLISNLYPSQPVIALTPEDRVLSQLSIFRSVYAVKITQPDSFEGMTRIVRRVCRDYRLAETGDVVIVTGGAPFGSTAPTNFMMFHKLEK
jgi:pyruvate kinase